MKKRGGKRPGAGRRKGSVSRATPDQKGTLGELARQYTTLAMATLARVAESGTSESAQVAASIAILDRGYGRPAQGVELTGKDGGPIETNDVSARELLSNKLAGLAARAGARPDIAEPH